MQKAVCFAAVLAAGVSLPALAQDPGAMCAEVPALYQDRCVAGIQAADAAQGQMGILIAGGSPGLGAGTVSAASSRATISGRANMVLLTLPDITTEVNPATPDPVTDQLTVLTAVVGADASFSVVPMVDLLASATFLPVDLISGDVFDASTSDLAWGAGARVNLLRESGSRPGVTLSAMYRGMGDVQIGNSCESDEREDETGHAPPRTTVCGSDGDIGQTVLGLSGISARATLTRQLLGLGMTLGAGFDRYSGDFNVSVLGARGTTANLARIYTTPTMDLTNNRFSGFLSASYTRSIGVLVAEVGWLSGGERIAGFPDDADFSPGFGSFFGSFGGRWGL
jgi:hypothetical protein